MEVRAAIYARYSTANQNEQSLADQVDRCRRWAAKHGQTVVAVFEDAAVSGTTLIRPGLDQLRDAVRKRKVDVILLDEVTRISRDIGGMWSLVFGDFDSAGVLVVDCLTGMDSSNPNVKMAWGMSGLMSTMMIDTTRAKTHGALDTLAHGGFHTGGPCFGYRSVESVANGRVRKVLVVNPGEAEVIRDVFTRYAAGESCRIIAAALNAAAVPAPRTGSKRWDGWHATTTRFILKNRRYMGEVVWNQRRFVKGANGKRHAVPRPPSEHITTQMPDLAIVTAELFQKAQSRFRGTRGGRPEGTMLKHAPSPLRGLARCGACGGGMFVQTRGKGRTMIRCSTNSNRGKDACPNGKSVAAERIVRYLESELLGATLLDDTFVDEVLAKYAQSRAGDTTALRADAEAAKARTKNVLDAITALGPQPELLARYQQEKAQAETLAADLARAEGSRRVPDRAAVVRAFEAVRAMLPHPAPAEQAAQLRERFSRITLSPSGSGWDVRAFLKASRLENSSGGVIASLPDLELVGFLKAA